MRCSTTPPCRRDRAIVLVSVAALALALLALHPFSASAGGSRRSVVHPTIGAIRCSLQRSKRSSSRGRSRRVCRRVKVARPKRGMSGGGSLEATAVAVPGGPPVSSGTGPVAGGSTATPIPSRATPAVEAPTSPTEAATPPWASATTDPIDPRFLTAVPFGTRSFWIQPWRAYLDTLPASRLIESLGINFNVAQNTAEDTARLLQDSGFKLARIGINWSALSYSEPTVFSNEPAIRARLTALQRHGLRPLIVLDANSLAPTPSRAVTLTTLAPAAEGARTVLLPPASAALVVPGKTGFNKLTFGGAADVLITAVSPAGVATLSRPLLHALPAGEHSATTLLYAPFARPFLANGNANPLFQETMSGWLGYVAAVNREASSVLGAGNYDLEVWNELSFGSAFLNAEHYYTPESPAEAGCTEQISPTEECESEEAAPEEPGGKKAISKEIIASLLSDTVGYVRDPTHGIPATVGITDGFASETPFPSGANAPLGMTALSKHPYGHLKAFPSAYVVNNIRPINALGQRDFSSAKELTPAFVPTYDSLFPEYPLNVTSTTTISRDLAPFTTDVYGFPHGREVGPAGGAPVQKWVTEYNLGSAKVTPVAADGVTPQPSAVITSADKAHFEAKALLRSLVAMVNKGVSREYFYAASNAGDLSMISEAFMSAAVAHPESYPGDALGGETMSAFHNLLGQFQGPGPGPAGARQLQLLSIAQEGNHAQFKGDGTPAHPDLYDREVLAVLPFQSSPTHFTIPVYVMTRDLLTLYQPTSPTTDIHRYDLPDETFRITLSNLPTTTNPPTITSYDPIRNENTPARLITRSANTATIELAATDYPRMLNIDYSS
jgi:hypothetical protein